MSIQSDKIENFEQAFSLHFGGCRRTCACGVTYFDGAQSYSWEEGELEALRADAKTVELDYSPSDIGFEGRQYVDACTCWLARADKLMGFIDGHAHAIAEYLSLEKKRLQAIADRAPTVEGEP